MGQPTITVTRTTKNVGGLEAPAGEGEIEPLVFREGLQTRDTIVLLSDGAWGPLGSAGVDRAVRAALSKHFSETPGAVLDAASRHGYGDDMTVVALRPVGG